jgi:glycosyltransferase involved in cell wall biosynthesis
MRNPYTWLLYANMPCQVDEFRLPLAPGSRYDILHVHWPESELNSAPTVLQAWWRLQRRFAAMDRLRAQGTKVIWTVHNLGAHEHRFPRLEGWFWRAFTRRVDGYVALTESGRAEAVERFPILKKVPGFVVPHGHYRGAFPDPPGVDARGALGLARNAKILLAFGRIRPYKNLALLIDVFRQCDDPDMVLYIAGPPSAPALTSELSARAAGDARIRIEAAHIPIERVHLYFHSADLVVLSYNEFWNSGIALMALSFNRPLLAPQRGAMKELSDQVGAEWVRTFDELSAGELGAALEWALRGPRAAQAPLDHLDWKELSMRTLDAYEQVIAQGDLS